MSKQLRHSPTRITQRDQRLILIATRRVNTQQEPLEYEVVQSLLDEATKRKWRLLALNLTGGSLTGEQAPAGALVTLLPDDPQAVRLGRFAHPDDHRMPAIFPDYTEAGRMAADYFAKRGFDHIALVGHEQMLAMAPLEAGMRERADANGSELHTYHFKSPEIPATGPTDRIEQHDRRANKLMTFLAELPKPVALFAASASNAGMISIICRRFGLAVPEDVAILSLGDQPEHCEPAPVPLSAIELSWRDIVRFAAQVLDELMAGQSAPPRTLVPPTRIIDRRSTDILAVADPTVARAIRFMWDHLDLDLTVDQVADAVNTPRYKLERLFRRHLERGVNAELRRARLERFAQLLRTTDKTVDQLAPQVGYRSARRLHVAFRDAYNQTPRRYRLQHTQA